MQNNGYYNENNFHNHNGAPGHGAPGPDQRPGPQAGGPRPLFTIGQTKKIARMRLAGQWHRAVIPVLIYALIYLLPSLTLSLIATIPGLENSLPLRITSDLFTIYQIIIMGAMGIGLAKLSLNIIREEDYSIGTIFYGFRYFGQSFFTGIITGLLTLLWVILFMLPGIIVTSMGTVMLYMGAVSGELAGAGITICGVLLMLAGSILASAIAMRYELSFFLAADNRMMRASHAVSLSVRLMKGNILRMFGLMLSFIGWAILAILPMYGGIVALIIGPNPVTITLSFILSLISTGLLSYVMIYMHVSSAVFYSDITGNFRPAAPAGGQDQASAMSQQAAGNNFIPVKGPDSDAFSSDGTGYDTDSAASGSDSTGYDTDLPAGDSDGTGYDTDSADSSDSDI